jgi:hypothetical protein
MRELKLTVVFLVQIVACYSQTIKPTIINLDELTIELVDFASYTNVALGLNTPSKTEIFADLGESFEGTLIKISSDKLIKIELEQRLGTSVTIMDEGPHCDLTEWRHYTTSWKKLSNNKNSTFRTLSYKNSETSKFPKVDMKDLSEEAEKECGQRWADLAKKAKSPSEYPCTVTVSRFFIKIKATKTLTGEKFEKVITIVMPMGC